ncbi:NAD-dependent epimerase/dehydratase family protein [Kribbella sp. NPDC050124]|uniref:NAD-dependent epimerase/dehydratase family protein n=1 Tax=Kribbella sp. NPDC050124 TaxID=3364114 RepID=UPI00379E7494
MTAEEMTMRVFVAGGTGVVGRPVVEALAGQGHHVVASTQRPDNLRIAEKLGATAVLMDGLDDASVRQAVLDAEPDVVVNLMTALSVPSNDYGKWLTITNRLRSEGTKVLMSAAHDAGAHRVVAQSASFMTRPGSGPTDETAPPYLDAPGPIGSHIQANIAAEEMVLDTPGVDGVVLRYGFLYGDHTAIGPGGDIAKAVEAGTMPIVGTGAGYYPFVHVDDAAWATVRAVSAGAPGVYNILDDEPAPQAEWLPYLAGILGGPAPDRISEQEAAERFGIQSVYYGSQLPAASNAKVKAELGLVFAYPSWRAGFGSVFGGREAS